jgi:hypothetical protein
MWVLDPGVFERKTLKLIFKTYHGLWGRAVSMDYTDLAQDMDKWRAAVNVAMNLLVT